MPIHVSIHDVSPVWEEEVDAALDACHRRGIRPALLVVPDFHRRAPLEHSLRYCERLRTLQESGHEVYLHGMFHESGGAPRATTLAGKARWYFAQRVESNSEAEFSDVSRAEALSRLDRGEAVLKGAGLRIDGFIPPAWSMAPWLLPILAERGYRFTEDHMRVYDPVAGTKRASVVLNFASRSFGKMASTVAYCRVAPLAHPLLPARVAIHPGDMNVLLLRRELSRLLDWAATSWAPKGTDLLTS